MSIILHPGQSEVYNDLFVEKTVRYGVAVCSRGWGKSYFAAVCATTAIFELMELATYVPNKTVYIIAPTYAQVTDIYFPLLAYELGLDAYAIKSSKDLGRFWFPRGVELRLVSYEAVERLRGTGAYFVVMDEVRDWTKGAGFKEAWESIIQPCINTRWSRKRAKQLFAKSPGRALCISTPKGYDYLYDMYHFQESDNDWKSYHYDYKSSPYLDEEEIEKVMHTIDPLKFAREYKASFEDSGNNVFYCFKRKEHVQQEVPDFEKGEDVHIGIDFNVGLQCSSVFAIRGGQVHYIDEFKGHPDTETLALAIKAKYKDKGHKVYVYPDPSGRARKTSAPVGITDFTILEAHGLITRAHKKAPPIIDSVASVNKMLKTASGIINLFIHPRCVGTIQSLERTAWVDGNSDTAAIDKKEGVEHFSDGVRYPMEYLFPIKNHKYTVKQGKTF